MTLSPLAYEWIKAFHLIAVIAWMAGMLYLPRLFVYHTQAAVGGEAAQTFKVMESKLLKIIMNPAMVVTWVLGLLLVVHHGLTGPGVGWLHAKLLLVVALSGVHGFLAASQKRFAKDSNERTEKFWRLFNEVPTVLMVLIVILVIVRPF